MIFTSGQGGESGVDGADTTAWDGDGTDTDDVLIVNGCLPDAIDGFYGYVHQCGGQIFASFSASGLSDARSVVFGNGVEGDFYSEPKVMACCSEFDDLTSDVQPHLYQCYVDLIETLCRSIPVRINEAAKDAGPAAKEQATSLANHIASASGQTECKDTFKNGEFANWEPGNLDSPLEGTWYVGNNDAWGDIQDPQITIDAEVTTVFLPADPADDIECVDNGNSDNQSFIVADEDAPELQLSLVNGDVVLVGPTTAQGSFTANPKLSSEMNGCSGRACSSISISENTADWTVHSWTFYSAGATEVSDTSTGLTVESFRLEAVGGIQGEIVDHDHFEIGAGQAWFLLTGTIDGFPHMLPVQNTRSIFVRRRSDTWTTSTVQVEFVDANKERWVLSFGGAMWHSLRRATGDSLAEK